MQIKNCGLSPITAKALAAKKLTETDDYMRLFPTKYRDFSAISLLSESVGKEVLVCGTVTKVISKSAPVKLVKAVIEEETTHTVFTVTWFMQDYLFKKISAAAKQVVVVGGTVTYNAQFGYQMSNPEFFYLKHAMPFGVYPKYRKIKGVSEEMQRSLYSTLNKYTTEYLEAPLLEEFGLYDLRSLYSRIHFPSTKEEGEQSLREYYTRELLYFATRIKLMYAGDEKGILLKNTSLADKFVTTLPFPLTDGEGQQHAVDVIKERVSSGSKLHALIQGDVGCGKTVVATYALLLAVGSGKQAVITAPTNILATQHFEEISERLKTLNSMLGTDYKVVLVKSDMKASEEKVAASMIQSGEANIIVGTHSVYSSKYQYHDLAMVIVDEEHRFGVEQRDAIKNKASNGVHVINMSATPIPRSLATILYGDNCEIIAIKTMPSNRIPVQSAICGSDPNIFAFIEKQLRQGRQAYVVCPLVDDGEDDSKKSVADTFARYQKAFGDRYKIAFAHGKMKKAEVDEVLEKFRTGEINILIATTVIEVGVNVPNANVIVIENAEQFGFATLHQLRGRVGRGEWASYCIFKSTDRENERLKTLVETTDGFAIAEKDLQMRGAGNLIGLKQTGYNRYLMLILAYPELYKRAQQMADWAIAHQYLNILTVKESDYIFDDIKGRTNT